jgi:hypothetical protein
MEHFKVLVCGGRDYGWKVENNIKIQDDAAKRKLYRALDMLLRAIEGEGRNLTLIHGAAAGADSLSDGWARERKVEIEVYPADWETHGRAAGFIRNSQMLKEGKPNLVLAFPGGRGTAMMVSLAEKNGVVVRRYY